ncbi:MAG: cytochrome b/b6 domain-containing protein [Thermoleophilia bacterium]
MAHKIPPTREEYPLPAIIMHAIHLISLLLLILTGFYIYSPFFGGFMGYARIIHQIAMWTFVLTTVTRIYWSFFGAGSAPEGSRVKRRDFHWFRPIKHGGEGTALDTLKYYMFLRKTYPTGLKLNPLQRWYYLSWAFVLIPVMLLTGLCLWSPTRAFFEPFTYWAGGLEAMRTYHYLLMWVFIVTVTLHIYLVIVSEASRKLLLMFAWREGKDAPPTRT